MSYQVLARKWRPRGFKDMVGQMHVLKALANALDTDRLHHAYLFTGTRGVGKTSLARILAKCLNCEQGVSSTPCGSCSACVSIDEGRFVDLIEVDAASRSKVDETRDLMDNVQYAPSSGRYKVYLIDEVHMFSTHSFNALLKTLEEPPPHVKFLLATTEPKKVPVTILSRCLQFNLKHLTAEQIAEQIGRILQQEQIEGDVGSIRLLSMAANGSMRDALSLLDQAISYGDGKLQVAQVREMLGTIDRGEIAGLIDALIEGDATALLAQVERIAEFNADYDAILAELLTILHNLAVAQALPEQSDTVDENLHALLPRISREDVQLYYQIALNGRRDLAQAPDTRTGFEMTMIRMLAFRPAPTAAVDTVSTPRTASRTTVTSSPSARSPAPVDQSPAVQPRRQPAESAAGNSDWKRMIDEMGLAGLVKELAGHCVLKEFSDNKVHLVLIPAQQHLLQTSQKDRLQDALKSRFGEQLKLLITVEEPERETPAQQRIRLEQERQSAAIDSFENDPNVVALVETFNAKVDKEKITPQ